MLIIFQQQLLEVQYGNVEFLIPKIDDVGYKLGLLKTRLDELEARIVVLE